MRAALCTLVVSSLVMGCSSHSDLPPTPQPVYSIASRQLPQEPVYGRVKYVYLPNPILTTDIPVGLPMEAQFKFDVKNITLAKAAKLLGSLSQYSSYCSGSIADNRITIHTSGSIEDIADAVAEKAGIRVVVDHQNREVRFFSDRAEQPRF